MHRASKLSDGDAKTDEQDASIIVETSAGIPDSPPPVPRSDASVGILAGRIAEAAAKAGRLDAAITSLLERNATYRCLLAVPGIGPGTASELVIGIDIAELGGHGKLASYCGLTPRNRQSGTSISSVTASQQGNKRLENLPIFSCNSLTRSNSRFGGSYRQCRSCGMPHDKAPGSSRGSDWRRSARSCGTRSHTRLNKPSDEIGAMGTPFDWEA